MSAMSLIQYAEVSSGGAASITLTSIPSGYDYLYLLFSGRTNQADNLGYGEMTVNTSTSNWSTLILQGRSSTVTVASGATRPDPFVSGGNTTADTFGVLGIYLYDYASANPKGIVLDLVTENNATGAFSAIQRWGSHEWNDSAAITSIEFTANSGSVYEQYSSVTLYGITAGSDGTTTVS